MNDNYPYDDCRIKYIFYPRLFIFSLGSKGRLKYLWKNWFLCGLFGSFDSIVGTTLPSALCGVTREGRIVEWS